MLGDGRRVRALACHASCARGLMGPTGGCYRVLAFGYARCFIINMYIPFITSCLFTARRAQIFVTLSSRWRGPQSSRNALRQRIEALEHPVETFCTLQGTYYLLAWYLFSLPSLDSKCDGAARTIPFLLSQECSYCLLHSQEAYLPLVAAGFLP